jgi:hypothetical protein
MADTLASMITPFSGYWQENIVAIRRIVNTSPVVSQ